VKKLDNNVQFRRAATRWDVFAAILAALVLLIEIAVVLAKPTISFDGTLIVVTNGVIAFALLVGAFIWALVEMFTPAGRSVVDLAVRFIGSFFIGAIIGGFLSVLFGFGQYLLIPVSYGNIFAEYMAVGFIFVFAVVVFNAAWLHNKASLKKYAQGM